ncbi:indolepyruvate oxidoreductase subunit beta family protein [Limobrevibacterium gyesilva]|uniref:Indolepyruvate oxidoreductase subunit beta family protein n=1 Tax=Limobrevibacterium gyesilva TaxID=2991712 RepID=A0AA42CF41_9PROT|nr:indolepyruvate oxidoreductase subunit beta family protein [Limobrevibacterium gyesilva]MCW3474361.1 indolepyruvate oxidoreductase subunit beta family protein [Limobrevibacterium gyesilva]
MDLVSLANDRPICIAIMAMGGQGGGVLADWIVAMAEAQGWVAQSTSVPGVAQRTGATIYYVELIRPQRNHAPVLSLMPVPGDVDVVIAAELMEAGRAIQRGLVSPDRTTLIASSHRSYAVTEKAKPGDGTADPTQVLETAQAVSQRFVCADMQRLAEQSGSVISSSLFGALAGSGALPFARAAFEATIEASGVGVEASLKAFGAGFGAVQVPDRPAEPPAPAPAQATGGNPRDRAELARALRRIETEFPADAHDMLRVGLRRLVDYQDVAYAHEYLDRLAPLTALDVGADHTLTVEAAKQVAVAMAYDDVIRVADLKTRGSRFDRVRTEVVARADQIVDTTEFMHPRVQEICATLPARLGRAVEGSAFLTGLLRRLFEHGRRVRTTHVSGFLPLYVIAGLRRWRRSLLRHQREEAHIRAWLDLVAAQVPQDYRLAVELLKCRRLVKGYSDTHARGHSKFDKVMGATTMLAGRADAADWIRRLRDAALADEDGKMLDGALATVATL